MPDEKLAPLSEPRVREFVTGGRVGRLATADAAGEPHVIPLCYWFDGEHIYFAIDDKPKLTTAMKLKRMRNIAENPRVALVIDQYEEDWALLGYVLIRGRARIVEEPQEYMTAMRNLRDKYLQYRRMALTPEKNPIVKIEPERVYAWGKRFRPTLNE